jgi:trehalose utilization protein
VNWAASGQAPDKAIHDAPNVPVGQTLEPVVERGAKLHQAGEEGYR